MARVTRGKFSSMAALAMPENVLYIDGEHSPAVLFARMVAANAHIERIIRVNGHSDGEADIFSALKRSLGDVSPALIVVDPLCSVLRHAHDMGAFQAVVSALQEIAWVAGRQS
jgi:hypothetical protein